MTDHVARQILDEVVSTCTGLTTTGTNVFRSRVHTMIESSLPALLIYAREDMLEEESSSMQTDGNKGNQYVLGISIDAVEKDASAILGRTSFVLGLLSSRHSSFLGGAPSNASLGYLCRLARLIISSTEFSDIETRSFNFLIFLERRVIFISLPRPIVRLQFFLLRILNRRLSLMIFLKRS